MTDSNLLDTPKIDNTEIQNAAVNRYLDLLIAEDCSFQKHAFSFKKRHVFPILPAEKMFKHEVDGNSLLSTCATSCRLRTSNIWMWK